MQLFVSLSIYSHEHDQTQKRFQRTDMAARNKKDEGSTIKGHRRALSFTSERELLEAVRALAELAEETPVDYDIVVGSYVIAMSSRVHRLLVPLLEERSLHFESVPVVPLSQLPPEEQAARRGLMRPRNIA
jgi:hypothetical protein